MGEALAAHRNEVQIATKFGVRHEGRTIITDSRPQTIRRSVESSLRRLNTDHIDLYYQHRIDKNISAEEVAGVMSDLIKEGKITHWGISEADEEYLRRANAVFRRQKKFKNSCVLSVMKKSGLTVMKLHSRMALCLIWELSAKDTQVILPLTSAWGAIFISRCKKTSTKKTAILQKNKTAVFFGGIIKLK